MKLDKEAVLLVIENEDELSNTPQDKIMEQLHIISRNCHAQTLMSLMRETVRITKRNIIKKINELDGDS